uniref:Uncharacterized protein n=1 Tax=Arundo donax TaxID=35708 RepID=A0A0A9HHP7_ARUDO
MALLYYFYCYLSNS